VELLGEELISRNKLRVQGDLRVGLQGLGDVSTAPRFAEKPFRILNAKGEVVQNGKANKLGEFELEKVPYGDTYLELEDVVIHSVQGEAEEPASLLPEAAGRTFSFVFTAEP
jgi:hypothetical protein